MGILADQYKAVLLPKMSVPIELLLLFDWIEANALYVDNECGRVGFLFPEDELKHGWTKTERPGGTTIEFAATGNVNVRYWFDREDPEILERLCVFAQTGAEGSEAALWLDDAGRQRIVHMGSGSGSMLCCVLADSAIDFLRLIAIGYDEICWDENFSYPPNHPDLGNDFVVHPNINYQNWLKSTFGVTIPERAIDIVKHVAHIGDKDSPDEFNRWVSRYVG
jgi:hypothetical protein